MPNSWLNKGGNILSKVKIICLGDSTTFGFPFGPADSWVGMLEEEIFGEVINKGINGNTTTDMLARFEGSVLKYRPDFVVITGGINDVVGGESLDRIQWNYTRMVETALTNNIKPIIGLPSAVDFVPWEKILQKLRDRLKEYANQLDLNIIDFSQAFYDEAGNIKTELLLADGGHPSQEGYKQMFMQININIFGNV